MHHNIYYLYISEFLIYYNIVFFILLPFYIICSIICRGKRHRTNLQTWSIPTLNFFTQDTVYFIFRSPSIISYQNNNHVCPF